VPATTVLGHQRPGVNAHDVHNVYYTPARIGFYVVSELYSAICPVFAVDGY